MSRTRDSVSDILKAIEMNDLEKVIKLLLGKSSSQPSEVNRALVFALINEDFFKEFRAAIPFLLDKGANPNNLPYCQNIENAKILLSYGADINATKNDRSGGSLLHSAVKSNNPDLVKFALENNADINVKNKLNQTPLRCLDNLIKENSPIFDNLIETKPLIYRLFAPYLINSNQKEEFIFILECQPSLDQVILEKLTPESTKNCVIWIHELLESDNQPAWLTAQYRVELNNFVSNLVNKLYPGLLHSIDSISDASNFDMVKLAILSENHLFGINEALDEVVKLYQEGLLSTLTAQKIFDLREKMEPLFVRYHQYNIKKPTPSHSEIEKINKLVEPLHFSLMSLGNNFSETAYIWQRKRILKKFSDIAEHPVKNKINDITQSSNWMNLSFACFGKKTRPLVELHKMQQTDDGRMYTQIVWNRR